MTGRPPTLIALLRGVNVGGVRLPMAELRTLCAELGWADVRTYIQSGNVVFAAEASPAALEAQLEDAVARRLRVKVPVIVRAAADWPAYVEGNPFPGASLREPNAVMIALSKAPPREGALEALQQRAVAGERVARVGDAIWIHYVKGVAHSKVAPASLDRFVGSPVTTRNWRTVLKLDELARGAGGAGAS